MLGDSGAVTFGGAALSRVESTDHAVGGDDTITAGDGSDVVVAGVGADSVTVGHGDNVVTGDNATLEYVGGQLALVDTTAPATGGNDTITTGDGSDLILAGTASDTVQAGEGNNVVVGDNGSVAYSAGALASVTTSDAGDGDVDAITTGSGNDVVVGGTAGDSLTAGEGNNTVLGDNGSVTYDGAALSRIESTDFAVGGDDVINTGNGNDTVVAGVGADSVTAGHGDNVVMGDNATLEYLGGEFALADTTAPATGGADTITTGNGSDLVLAGDASDTVQAGEGDNVVLGDNGYVDYTVADGDASDIDLIESTEPEVGGADTITTGDGSDIIVGGTGADGIAAGGGRNIVVGDSARITAAEADSPQWPGQPLAVGRVESIAPSIGGGDTIAAGDSCDIIIGGFGSDTITAGAGFNVILGDNGSVDWVIDDGDPSDIDRIGTTDSTIGDTDVIIGGLSTEIIIGGAGADVIDADQGDNIVLGDHGTITILSAQGTCQNLSLELGRIATSNPSDGGSDTITTGAGNDTVLAGAVSDTITAGDGNNIVLGDNGLIDYVVDDADPSDIDRIQTTDPTIGGSDTITTGAGNDMIVAGTAGDTVNAGAGNDLVFGDHGMIAGDVDAALLPLAMASHPFAFTATFTQNTDLGGNDRLVGEAGDDILLGQQGTDTILGGAGDDDIIGGHNVADGHDAGDFIDAGTGNDAVAGDNASVLRTGQSMSTRIRVLTGETIYDADGNPLVTPMAQSNPTDAAGRDVTLFNHSATPLLNTSGDDYLTGGADDDVIFGQLGNDVTQGDAAMTLNADGAADLAVLDALKLTHQSVADRLTDGDDYIEGNGGDDLIFGGLGQDDIVGGSSSLFGLSEAALRPDGADTIYGGAGTDVARDTLGDLTAEGHALDADVILGDNGNIYRLVGTNAVATGNFLTFNYDNYGAATIIPRAFEVLDYTLGGDAGDLGAGDVLHGEAGDDVVHGMSGNDVIFGEGQDDDLYGGVGHDRLYGGAGEDGIIGDDGKILTSRNGLAEPLSGLFSPNEQTTLSVPGPFTGAVVYIAGRLHKSVILSAWEVGGNDVIYGGLGDDFLHGGAGDDAISGAEALDVFYNTNAPTEVPLPYDAATGKFDAYDADNPMVKIDGFLLNFDATDETGAKIHDGKDRIFGDLGNDWLVGGTGHDRLFGGMGNDLMNADDNHDTNGGLNNRPDDPEYADGDFAFGGGGVDVLIANTGNDRLFDWLGEFNSFLVPFSPFGCPTVNRLPSPHVQQFILDLGAASGADQTLAEPNGELGLVSQGDAEWQDQHGKPRDPQPGNTKAKRDTQGAPEDDTDPVVTAAGSTVSPIVEPTSTSTTTAATDTSDTSASSDTTPDNSSAQTTTDTSGSTEATTTDDTTNTGSAAATPDAGTPPATDGTSGDTDSSTDSGTSEKTNNGNGSTKKDQTADTPAANPSDGKGKSKGKK